MEQLIVASSNLHKIEEYRTILGDRYNILSLKDLNCDYDIPENGDTFEENALIKARWVACHYGCDCIADDSGLEVDALGGAPGVRTARYAGEHHDNVANRAKLLRELGDTPNRHARFRTAIALVRKGKPDITFDGTVEGTITHEERGGGGFGYDCLFIPDGWSETFAEASPQAKNAVSHRSRAAAALLSFLDNEKSPNSHS